MRQHIVHHGRRLLIGIVLAWGALALIVRLATPLLEWAHHPLERWLSEQAGQAVRFAHMEASWWGIGPRLRLQQLRVGEGPDAVQLDEVEADLSHLSLLRGRLLEALRLTLDGLALKLVRETDGRLHIEGFPARQQGGAAIPLPRHLRLRNVRLEWEDRLRGRPSVVIDPIDLDLIRRDQLLRLRGRLQSPLGEARFGADIQGFLTTEHWNGTSYLKVDGLRLAGLLRGYLPQPYRLATGTLDLELWQEWVEARESASRGSFDLADLRLETGTPRPPLEVAMLRGIIDYRRQDDRHWQIRLSDTQLRPDPSAAPLRLEAVVRRSQEGGQPRFDLGVSRLPLDLLQRAVLQQWPGMPAIPSSWLDGIDGLNPHGELRDIRARWSPGTQGNAWALSARLHRTRIAPWQAIPGIRGLSGRLVAHPGQVDLQLEGTDLLLDHRQLFRWSHPLKRLQGELHWLAGDDGWTMIIPRLRLETPDTNARLWLQLRSTQQRPLRLDLRAHLDEGPVGAVPRYLPTAIMDEALVQWLDRSLGSGRLLSADLLVSGPLADFPFHRTHNGSFQVLARATGVNVQYEKDWPPLEKTEARLAFHQNSLRIDLLEGRLYHSRIRKGRVRLSSLAPVSPVHISGQLEGPLEDELRLLQSPALGDRFAPMVRQLRASGPVRLDLDLRIPLTARHPQYRLDARLRLLGNRLTLENWKLDLEKLRGTLQIDLDAVRAKGITGVAFGRPLTLDVTESPQKGTRIQAHTRWDISLLQQRFPALPLQIAQGGSEVTLWLDVPRDQGTAILTVHSPLKGIGIELPPPLGKTPKQERPLMVSLPLDDPPGPVHLRYGKQLDARFTLDGSRSELRYARGAAQLPERPLHRVLARLPSIDLEAWRAAARRLSLLLDPSTQAPPWEANLSTEALRLGEVTLTRATLHTEHREKGQVEIGVDSLQAKGVLRYRPAGRGVLVADFERLHLPFDASDDTDNSPPDPRRGPDPRKLPQVDFTCKDLRLAKARLGAARLVMRPEDRGARIATLGFEGPSGLLTAQGNWLWEKSGAAHTWLNGLFDGGDLGALLAGLGYPRVMEKGRARIRFDLDWPGHPLQLHRATLGGTAELDLRDGRLSELEPGISRVLGLLSLDALKRRLKLDFGDLLKKGYSFDAITGNFTFGGGQARTRDLVVDGPSGRIEFGGRIGLLRRDFDSVVQVTPKLDATLVVASTIAGGPVAGAATFLAQRLLSEEVDRINRFEYSVTGSWDAPKITPLNSGGPLSRIVNTLGGRKSEAKTEAQEQAIDESKTQPNKGLLERIFGTRQPPHREDEVPEGSLPGQD
ncbi:MAG: TIGR02099 family protein [Gammaproteobacteria bacterium]|nr:MAG: TIGR02099 family protein [Gammaproteobacteria bacterium]